MPIDVRTMRADDVDAVAHAHVRGWQVGYRGIIPQPILDGLSLAHSANRFRSRLADPVPRTEQLVAVHDGQVCGWASPGPCRDDDRVDRGELMALYVHPDHWRSGAGSALLTAALESLRHNGFDDVTLWVLVDNTRARAFYEHWEFRTDGHTHDYVREGARLPELRYHRSLG